MKITKLTKDLIIMGTCILFTLCLIVLIQYIDFEVPTVETFECKKVFVKDLKTELDLQLCTIVVENEEIIDAFYGYFEHEFNQYYHRFSYNINSTQYIYTMFPKGEIRIYSLKQNNDYIYTLTNSYSWEDNNE